MAALVRNSLLRLRNPVIPQVVRHVRLISTSKKNSDTATVATPKTTTADPPTENKNWVSYGFDTESQEEDTNYHHATYFFSVSLILVVGGCGWAYTPDLQLRNWASREAFLELRRREAQGLPLIDRNLVDPSLIVLPSEEELGDREIII